jgi:putative oxidoreductase
MNAIYIRMEMWAPYVLSILRIVVGLLFLQHGLSKVFNFPAPSPVASLSGLMILAAFLETAGAFLFLIGAYTRIVAFILSGEMAFAYFMAHAPRES